jgi:hypothetical protein
VVAGADDFLIKYNKGIVVEGPEYANDPTKRTTCAQTSCSTGSFRSLITKNVGECTICGLDFVFVFFKKKSWWSLRSNHIFYFYFYFFIKKNPDILCNFFFFFFFFGAPLPLFFLPGLQQGKVSWWYYG